MGLRYERIIWGGAQGRYFVYEFLIEVVPMGTSGPLAKHVLLLKGDYRTYASWGEYYAYEHYAGNGSLWRKLPLVPL